MKNKFNYSKVFKGLLVASFSGTALVTPTLLSHASDTDIYAGASADGTKTFVMMLDNSGSMGTFDASPTGEVCSNTARTVTLNAPSGSGVQYTVQACNGNKGGTLYDRMGNLKIAMFNFMNIESIASDKTASGFININEVVMGLGAFPQGSGGQILVSAKTLGPKGSTQRLAIENAMRGLQASGTTPTAYAYATAASHILGTSTSSDILLVDRFKKTGNTWEQCKSWTSTQFRATCNSWIAIAQAPGNLTNYYNFTKYPGGFTGGGYYRKVENSASEKIVERYWLSGTNWYGCTRWNNLTNTGLKQCNQWNTSLTAQPNDIWDYYKVSEFDSYYNTTTNSSLYRRYGDQGDGIYVDRSKPIESSPLPAIADRKTCDGQGVYILSDGEPNYTPETTVAPMMQNALGVNTSFSCPNNGLVNTTYGGQTNSGWHCMGEFAKRLYATQNVQNLKFKTAFVGYGASFSSLSNQDQINACKLGSAKKGDSCSPDSSLPNAATIKNDATGYGLGGYTYAKTSQDVLDSIVKFIDGLDGEVVSSLPTGVWAVPVDTLNPSRLQSTAYMRVLQPEPNSGKLTWAGNLKKYHLVNGVLRAGNSETNSAILDVKGGFTGPSDQWGIAANNEAGAVTLGGAYSKVPLPKTNTPTNLRRLFTDITTKKVDSVDTIARIDNDSLIASSDLLQVVDNRAGNTTDGTFVLNKFKNQDKLKLLSNRIKSSLINYLGYSIPISDSPLPDLLSTPVETQNAMGGIIHSVPLQLTYEGTLDEDGVLTATRKQSTLFGTMEGGLRLVNASDGVEQMTFVPSDVLLGTDSVRAFKPNESSTTGLAYGVDAPWTADSAYSVRSVTVGTTTTNYMTAIRMNVYGGLRMGGESYFGLDLQDPENAKFLFRIGRDQTDFSRMGQSWSKPILTNIRYAGKIRRVMIVGGGYDKCYEDPRFTLKSTGTNTTCTDKTIAQGNAVYVVDALTGERLWWTSNTGSNTNNVNLKHSVVSSIAIADGDNDGLTDHLYFGDLGGQVFRADLNNKSTSASGFGVRVVRLADLATSTTGVGITNGDNPRFYEAPTITVHKDLGARFVVVGLASGDRSSPLDVAPNERIGLPSLLTGRPVNNVYALMDIDVTKRNIIESDASLEVENLTRARLLSNPYVTTLEAAEFIRSYAPYVAKPATGTTDNRIFGWYTSLSKTPLGVEKADGTFRKSGGLKAYEAPIAISNNLIISVYDPESKVLGYNTNPCEPRIIGETYRQLYCLPFGKCMTKDNAGAYSYNSTFESKTAYQYPISSTDPNPLAKPVGVGIQGNVLADKTQSTVTACGSLQLAGNTSGSGEWVCDVKQQPLSWYSNSIKAN